MGDHDTWYTLLMPEFWHQLEHNAAEHLARDWKFMMFGATHFTLVHVAGAIMAGDEADPFVPRDDYSRHGSFRNQGVDLKASPPRSRKNTRPSSTPSAASRPRSVGAARSVPT